MLVLTAEVGEGRLTCGEGFGELDRLEVIHGDAGDVLCLFVGVHVECGGVASGKGEVGDHFCGFGGELWF
mgnify:CR=1 FL=1